MKKMMILFFILFPGFFVSSCDEHEHAIINTECISGKIVGQKCDVYALQLDEKELGATDWTKKNLVSGEIERTFSNVIGLIELPEEFRFEGKTIFVIVEEYKNESVPCYLDLPGPPSPYYTVISASESPCKD